VGLETGIESVKSFSEYENQLETLVNIENPESVTMNEFSNQFRSLLTLNPEKIVLKDSESEWTLTPQERNNDYLKDEISYQENLAFTDYFLADKSDFLDRVLPINHSSSENNSTPTLILFAFILGFVAFRRHKLAKYYWQTALFILASFLTTLMGFSKFGWGVYVGPVFKNIGLVKFSVVIILFCLFIPLLKHFEKRVKNTKLLMLILPLSFSIDFTVSILRYIQLNDQHYFGIGWDALRFVGIKISPKSLEFVNQDFSSVIASSFLKFDFTLIWQDKLISLVVYPLVHIILTILIYFIIRKLPKKLGQVILIVTFVLFCLFVYKTITLAPRIVL